MDTLETIKQILSEKEEIAPERVTKESTLEDLGLDSLSAMELICELEDRLDIDLGDDVYNIKTIGEFISHVDKSK